MFKYIESYINHNFIEDLETIVLNSKYILMKKKKKRNNKKNINYFINSFFLL
jgi:hypothetical protein